MSACLLDGPVSKTDKILSIRKRGDNQHTVGSQNIATLDEASRRAGFGNRETARQAKAVVDRGVPEVVEALAAIEAKLEDQVEFVRWWDESVRPAGQGRNVAVRGQYSVDEAEAATAITKQQVSKWRRRLKEPEKYRATISRWLTPNVQAHEGRTPDNDYRAWLDGLGGETFPTSAGLRNFAKRQAAEQENGPHRTDAVSDLAALAESGEQLAYA